MTFTTSWTHMVTGGAVAVDCDPPRAGLTLSHHWDGNDTPLPFRDDLATGAALKWAESPERARYLGTARHIYNNHYDVDGLLSAWVVMEPEEALRLRKPLLAAAAAGDFSEWTSEVGVQFAMLGGYVEEEAGMAALQDFLEIPRIRSDKGLYDAMLRALPDLLEHPERLGHVWRRGFEDLQRQIRVLSNGGSRIEDDKRVLLSTVVSPRFLRWRAVLARAHGDRLLQVVPAGDGYLYEYRNRPYQGYRIVSRAMPPLHTFDEIAGQLNARWPTEAERWQTSGWWSRRLRLTARGGTHGSRSIPRTPPEVALPILREVLETLDAKALAPGPDPDAARRGMIAA